MSQPHVVTRANVEAAHMMIAPHVRRTPVIDIAPRDLGLPNKLPPVVFKLEHLQHSGSFKARGALNSVLTSSVPKAGVTAASGGNHGAALAFAARKAGVPCTIFVFDFTPAAKIERIRSYGAEVHSVEGGFDALMAKAQAFSEESGALSVHAFDAPGTLAGQGTVALEFMEQAEPDTILVATGGGGLIGGIAAYVETRARVISIEPEAAPTLHSALAAGQPVQAPAGGIAADSLGPGQVGSLMYPIADEFVHEALLVPDVAIRDAWQILWDQMRTVVEPGGATALAALLSGAYRPEPDERVGVVLCGANTNVVSFPD